jgi:hypothetical protein
VVRVDGSVDVDASAADVWAIAAAVGTRWPSPVVEVDADGAFERVDAGLLLGLLRGLVRRRRALHVRVSRRSVMLRTWLANFSFSSTRIEPGPRAFVLNLKLVRDGRSIRCELTDVEVRQLQGSIARYLDPRDPRNRTSAGGHHSIDEALNSGDGSYRP